MSAKPPTLAAISAETFALYQSLTARPSVLFVLSNYCKAMLANRERYEAVALVMPNQMPWVVVALIHAMEASLSFQTHLHNGDSLKRQTVNVPAGRPEGQPPFTWEHSAKDALRFDNFHKVPADEWRSVAGILYRLEGYNGWGPRLYHSTRSAYLWAGSNHEQPGKYVEDGKWDSTARSKQVGAALLLQRLCTIHAVSLQAAPNH